MKAKKQYTVIYELDESGMWVARVRGLPGCITQGRTIEQTRARAREAIQVVLDLPKPYDGELIDDVALGSEAKAILMELDDVRGERLRLEAIEREKLQNAIDLLTKIKKISLRDAGELVGVSRQRVHQIVQEMQEMQENAASRPRRAADRRARVEGLRPGAPVRKRAHVK